MAQGRFEEAIPVYRALTEALPDNSGLLLNLAMAETLAGRPKEAVPHLTTVLKSEPNSVPALHMLAMARLQLNQPDLAIAPLKKLLMLTPNDVNARGMLAGAEMSLQRYREAAADYRELTRLAPGDAKGWYGLGKAYEALASSSFEQLNKQAPQSAYVALLLGDARLQRRQYRSAFFFYKEAEKQMPELPGLHAGLAAVYEKTGHADWAAQEQAKEKSAGPPKPRATPGTPQRLFEDTRYYNQQAVEAFERLGHLPESVELHALRAQIAHDHGQDLEAAKEWKAAMAIAPPAEQPRLRVELATSLFLGRDYQNAMPMIRDLLRAEPDSPDYNFMLGESLWRTQQAEQAVPYLEKALRANPEMLPAHAALGLALVSLNRYAEAVKHLEKAVQLDDDGSLHYSLARAYQALGDQDHARQNMQEYNRIQKQNAEVNGELAKEAEITGPRPK